MTREQFGARLLRYLVGAFAVGSTLELLGHAISKALGS